MMGTPVGTVMFRLHRGRQRLRELLRDYAPTRRGATSKLRPARIAGSQGPGRPRYPGCEGSRHSIQA
jgi:hypothetical protein